MAGFALWQTRRQNKDQREANRLLQEAAEQSHLQAEATERRAYAVEQMLDRLTAATASDVATPPAQFELAAPSPLSIAWSLEHRGKHTYVLRNEGTETATGVRVDPANLPPTAINVPENAVVRPQESVDFVMASTFGGLVPNEIWVSWDGHEEPVAVRVPG
ncbi:hypothetical protein BX266_3471 [Streptomyces sp. TLI_171]|nr:hypothetical protein BX266_3471 [Streptomyces sp. TLI_171]